MFVDRKAELSALEEAYRSEKAEFFIVFGRRRIGKTALIKEFATGKRHLYFLAKKQKIPLEIERLAERIAEELGIYVKSRRDLESVFREVAEKLDPKEKTIIVIDEFTYWVEQEEEVLSEFQAIWDEILSEKNVFLVLSGSAMSVMESEVMGAKSPLHGRRTGQIHLQQLPVSALRAFLPSYSFADIIRVYGVTGGVPYYIREFSDKKTFKENLLGTVFNKSNILSMEAEILLREELREIHAYFAILRAVLEGATKTNEIASKSQVDMTNINKYLRVLMQLKLIEKEYPVTEPAKSRNFVYRIKDNYVRFWLKYYYYNEGAVEENPAGVVESVLADYDDYIGRYVFEEVCRNALPKLAKGGFQKIGRWWSAGSEMDLVAIDDEKGRILFGECKWRKRKAAAAELEGLVGKSAMVRWKQGKRNEEFVFFSKSGFEENAEKFAKEKGIMLFGLENIEKAMGSRQIKEPDAES